MFQELVQQSLYLPVIMSKLRAAPNYRNKDAADMAREEPTLTHACKHVAQLPVGCLLNYLARDYSELAEEYSKI